MKRSFVVLAVLAAAGGLLAACGGNDNKSTDASSDTTAKAASATPTTAAATTTLALSSNDELGQFLVGSNGHTLYLFEKDTGTTTGCTGGCVNAWPALTSATPSAATGIDASKVSTAATTGTAPNQVVFNGHLLYYFGGDQAPGDTNGLGIPSWYPVDASGNKIDKD